MVVDWQSLARNNDSVGTRRMLLCRALTRIFLTGIECRIVRRRWARTSQVRMRPDLQSLEGTRGLWDMDGSHSWKPAS